MEEFTIIVMLLSIALSLAGINYKLGKIVDVLDKNKE